MNLAIIGSRSFNDYDLAKKHILQIANTNQINLIISGGAKGADYIAEQFANEFNIPITIFKPDWNIGKHAGMLRNTTIIDHSTHVIAFWDMMSTGTKDSINKAKKANKELYIIDVNKKIYTDLTLF